jgi:uncharacterized membrane protein
MDDHRLENMIGQFLRAGVLLAAATVFAGGVLYLARHHANAANFHTFVAGGADMRSVSGILRAAGQGSSVAIMQVGLLLLILTPITRVAIAVVGFLLEKDRLYAVVSLIVLGILAFSLVHAG